jgi:hypothetical protein
MSGKFHLLLGKNTRHRKNRENEKQETSHLTRATDFPSGPPSTGPPLRFWMHP